jgi:hypothetical protein
VQVVHTCSSRGSQQQKSISYNRRRTS